MKTEKDFKAKSGYMALFIVIVLIIGMVLTLVFCPDVAVKIGAGIVLFVTLFCIGGFSIVNPNESSVMVLLELTKEPLRITDSGG